MVSRIWYYVSMVLLGSLYLSSFGLSFATAIVGVVLWVAHAKFWGLVLL